MEHRLTEKDIKLFNAVAKMQNGEKASFNDVYEFSYKYLYKIVYDILKDAHNAEDLLQETYMKIYEKIDTLHDIRTFYVWAGRIATNNALRYIQKYRKEVLATADEEGSTDFIFENADDDKEVFIPESIIMDKEKRRIIGDILDNLSTEQKIAVQYFYFEEMSVNEIADNMGCSSGTIKSRLNYARNAIKEAVLRIEKTQGTKLYSLGGGSALWIFLHIAAEKEVSVSTAAIISSIVNGATINGGATSSAAQIGANTSFMATGAGSSAETAMSLAMPEEVTSVSVNSAMSAGVTETSSVYVNSAMSEGVKNVSEAALNEASTEATKEAAKEVTTEIAKEAATDVTKETLNEVSNEITNEISKGVSNNATKEISKKAAKTVAKKAVKTSIKTKIAIVAATTVTAASVTTAVVINNNKDNKEKNNNEPIIEASAIDDEVAELEISANGELAPEIQKTYLGDVNLGIMYANSDGVILQVANDNFEYGFVFLSTPEYKGQDASKITEVDEMYSEVKELALNNGVKYYYAGAEIQQDCEPVIYKWVDILEKARGNLGNDRDYYEYVYNEFRGFVINTSDGIYYVETCYVGEGEYNYSVDDEDDGYSFNVVDSETGFKYTTDYYDYGNNDIEFTCRIPSKLYKIEGNYSEPSIGDESDESSELPGDKSIDPDDAGLNSLGTCLIDIEYDPNGFNFDAYGCLVIVNEDYTLEYYQERVAHNYDDLYEEDRNAFPGKYYGGYDIEADANKTIYQIVDILDRVDLNDKDYQGGLERELDGFYISTPDGRFYIKIDYNRTYVSYEPSNGDRNVRVQGEGVLYKDEKNPGN